MATDQNSTLSNSSLPPDVLEEMERLNQEAAKAMYAGRRAGLKITRDEALRWITIYPAWALGIEGSRRRTTTARPLCALHRNPKSHALRPPHTQRAVAWMPRRGAQRIIHARTSASSIHPFEKRSIATPTLRPKSTAVLTRDRDAATMPGPPAYS